MVEYVQGKEAEKLADLKELYLMLLRANEEAMEVLNNTQNNCEVQYAELADEERQTNKFL